MSEGRPRYSADGKWWWDGEQWRPAERSMAPFRSNVVEPPSQWHWRRRVVLAAVVVVIVAAAAMLATAVWPLRARFSLPSLPRSATTHRASTHRATTPSPSPRPSPLLSAAQQQAGRYRRVADGGGDQVKARAVAVTSSCSAPANLAVCRTALVHAEATEADVSSRLASISVPACLTGPDGQQRTALAALERGARQAVSGIDQGDPGQIVGGVAAVKQAEQDREAAQQQVGAAPC